FHLVGRRELTVCCGVPRRSRWALFLVLVARYTRRFFGGRQPLWGSGVTSSMPVTLRPAFWSWRTACSRPAPGPLTLTSISIMPLLRASDAGLSAAPAAGERAVSPA